ncbi:hypothetical protein [Cereibacter sphaeroides]|uniref:hypothetical protein n=1 Tax=Cereibacter sphaeroides TaxID=1063 RepID=UPI003FCCCC1C
MQLVNKKGVSFYSKWDAEPANIGDQLASPMLYFDFNNLGSRKILVVGGGAIPDALEVFPSEQHDARIVWGVGKSEPLVQSSKEKRKIIKRRIKSRLASLLELIFKAETRVVSSRELRTAASYLVPCPSCLHPVCTKPRGKGVAVVLNANDRVSGSADSVLNDLKRDFPGIELVTNSIDEVQLLSLFGRTDWIITNSYHMTYWSLLSGGKVTPIAHSSKIPGLLSLFDLPREAAATYRSGDSQQLGQAIRDALAQRRFIELEDPRGARARFCSLNETFASAVMQAVPDLEIQVKPSTAALRTQCHIAACI